MRSASEGGQGQRSREWLRKEIGIWFMISFRPLTSDDRAPSYEAAAADLVERQAPGTVREDGGFSVTQLALGA
jgi:biotin-(acetyl-CoA carboxylase) ligase